MHPNSAYDHHQDNESKSAQIRALEEFKKTLKAGAEADAQNDEKNAHKFAEFFKRTKGQKPQEQAVQNENQDPAVEDPVSFSVKLIKEYTHDIIDGQIARLEGNYEEILRRLGIEHDEQINRLTDLLTRQNAVIAAPKLLHRFQDHLPLD